MNKTLLLLLSSDIFILTGFGLVTPILAIFLKDNIIGGTIATAGIASTVYLIMKAVIQIPFSRYIDNHGDRRRWILVGTFMQVCVPIIYLYAKDMITIYIAQAIYGIGSGLASAAWLNIWSRHLEKNHESFDWSIYSASTGIGMGITAMIGALIAEYFGFQYTLGFVACMIFIGAIILLRLDKSADKIPVDMSSHYHNQRKHS